jgi:predicted nucleic acid-binding protein
VIVVDASVVVLALIGSRPIADTARQRLSKATQRHGPHLLDVEVTSALRRLAFRGEIPENLADAAIRQLGQLDITRFPHTPFLDRVWELRHAVSPYDAVYVALAEAVGAPLVTAGARLAATPALEVDVELLA